MKHFPKFFRPTRPAQVATEGFVSAIFDMFRNKEGDKPVKAEKSMYEWLNENVKVGKLNPNLVLKATSVTLSESKAKMFFRGETAYTQVDQIVAEFKKDAAALKTIFNQINPTVSKMKTLVSKLGKEVDTLPGDIEQTTWLGLKKIILNLKGKASPPLSDHFTEPTYQFLGNYTKDSSFLRKEKIGNVEHAFNYEPKATAKKSLLFEALTKPQLDTLMGLAMEIGNLSHAAWELGDEASGLDMTDHPFRGFIDEIDAEKGFNETLAPYVETTAGDWYFNVAQMLEQRIWLLEEALWFLIRESVKPA